MCVIKCKAFITIRYFVAWKVYLSLMETALGPPPEWWAILHVARGVCFVQLLLVTYLTQHICVVWMAECYIPQTSKRLNIA